MTPETAFHEYGQAVYSLLFRLMRREDFAEDLAQETFHTYLFSIARNLALKHYRDRRTDEYLDDEIRPLVIDPRQSLDVESAVAGAVASPPPLQQEALILFEYEGATLEEIAQIVSADVGSVKSRLHRARVNLKRMLAP